MNISEIFETPHEEWIEFSCNKIPDAFCIEQKNSMETNCKKLLKLKPAQFSDKFFYKIKLIAGRHDCRINYAKNKH